MLWGHCIQKMIPSNFDFFENTAYKIIYSFHMPCFALVSGYLLFYSFNNKKYNVNEALGKRILSLIIPIIFAQIFNTLLYYFPNLIVNFSVENLKLFFTVLKAYSSLWFFWSILAAAISIAIAKRISNNICVQLLFLFMLIPFVHFLPCGGNNLFMYPYVVIGYYFCKYKDNISDKIISTSGYLMIPIFVVLMHFFEKKHYIYTTGIYSPQYSVFENIDINLFRYAIGLIGSIAFISFANLVFKLLRRMNYLHIDLLGKYSLEIYALSVALLSWYLPKIMNLIYVYFPSVEKFFVENYAVYTLIITLLVAIIYSFVLCGVIKLMKKIKISRYIYGR